MQLEGSIQRGAISSAIGLPRLPGSFIDMIGQRAANERRANAQIAPGLSIPDRRGELGQCEQSFHLVFGDRTRQKVAYVPAPYQQSLQHVGRRCRTGIWPGFFHQNSIPAWAFTPPRKGCFTKAISVTRSARSAETTPELQSLMRISYAVYR